MCFLGRGCWFLAERTEYAKALRTHSDVQKGQRASVWSTDGKGEKDEKGRASQVMSSHLHSSQDVTRNPCRLFRREGTWLQWTPWMGDR